MLKRVPVVLDTDRDADIVRWLETQENRSAAIRKLIRDAIRARAQSQSGVDVAMLRQVLREELSKLTVTAPPGQDAIVNPPDEDPEAAILLDAMF